MNLIQRIKKKLGFSYQNEFGIKFAGSRKARKAGKWAMKKFDAAFRKLAEFDTY